MPKVSKEQNGTFLNFLCKGFDFGLCLENEQHLIKGAHM